MECSSNPFRISVVAAAGWLSVLPPSLLLAASVLRQLQPRQYEPARTISMFFEWVMPHISRASAALLFIGLPGVAVVAGGLTLRSLWHGNETLRQDALAAVSSLQRHLSAAILATATLIGGAILVVVFAHILTD
jgi:hypothetical protein